MNLKKLVEDRDKALLSMDKETILAYARKYEIVGILSIAHDEYLFWASIHKARTACINLPYAERLVSKAWLAEHGMKPLPGADI